MGDDRFELLAQVARERVAHLDRWAELLGPLREHLGQVLSGMLAAGEEERDPAPLARGHDARGEDPGALRAPSRAARQRPRLRQLLPSCSENLHRRVVVVQHLALRRLADQLLVGRLDHRGALLDDLPLRRGRQRNAQAFLQPPAGRTACRCRT